MFMHVQRLINDIVPDEPDPAAANALQEGLGGQFGEMRTMMQYLFQAFNFRGATGKPYRDLLYGIGTEEIAHVELIATTISRLLDGSPQYKGKATKPLDEPGKGGATPLSIALDHSNIHHYLVGAQGALPVDAAGNPWSGSYVYNSGNLVLDLLYNLMLESTGMAPCAPTRKWWILPFDIAISSGVFPPAPGVTALLGSFDVSADCPR